MFATSPYLFGQRRGEKREEREKTERERAVSNQAWSQQERSKANNTQTTNNHKYLYYFSSTPTQHSSPKKNHLHFKKSIQSTDSKQISRYIFYDHSIRCFHHFFTCLTTTTLRHLSFFCSFHTLWMSKTTFLTFITTTFQIMCASLLIFFIPITTFILFSFSFVAA